MSESAGQPAERLDPGLGPDRMRAAVAAYVRALHEAYLDASAGLTPADRGRLPMLSGVPVSVVAAAAQHLHVVATTEAMPPLRGPEVEVRDGLEAGPQWVLRFADPVVIPALGLVDESVGPGSDEVRRILGVRTHLYHLVVQPGGSLDRHHAHHAGTGLAHAHAAAVRDFEAARAHARGHEALVDEAAAAAQAGLPRALTLLAAAVAPHDLELARWRDTALAGGEVDPVAVRRALLAAVRP